MLAGAHENFPNNYMRNHKELLARYRSFIRFHFTDFICIRAEILANYNNKYRIAASDIYTEDC